MEDIYEKELSFKNTNEDEAIKGFIKQIGAEQINREEFVLNGEKWLIDFHIFSHSDDVIIEESISNKFDKFLLVKVGSDNIRIVGWTDKKTLLSTPSRDIYRIGKRHHIVVDVNLNNLVDFKILKKDLELKTDFIINSQEAENLGHTEMISGILAGLHYFAKKAGVYFKDINLQDEFVMGDLKGRMFVRDVFSDEDMLIPETYFLNHPEIDIYILCKIKGGRYNYFGYTTKSVVEITRTVQMTGGEDMDDTGEKIRRIFAEQYLNLSDFFKIYEKKEVVEIKIELQKYVPLHQHSEFSIGDAFGKISYITDCLKAKGFKTAALTDHGTLSGVYEFQRQCLAKDLKPIIGIEAYIKINEKHEDARYHITIFVKDETGWKNLLKLQAKAVRENFYYKPIILIQDLFDNHEGLIVTSGCANGIIPRMIADKEFEQANAYMDKLKEVFKDDFYCEMMLHNINNNQETLRQLYNFAIAKDIKCIFTTDTHYSNKEDIKYHEAIKAINMKKKYGQAGYGDDIFYLLQTKDINERLEQDEYSWMKPNIESFMQNTFEIADKCNFIIKPVEEMDTLPNFDFAINENMDSVYLKDIISEFLSWKEQVKKNNEMLILTNHTKVESE